MSNGNGSRVKKKIKRLVGGRQKMSAKDVVKKLAKEGTEVSLQQVEGIMTTASRRRGSK